MNFIELAKQIRGAKASRPLVFTQVSTDTRSIAPGAVFVALRGENFDGHQFVAEAVNKGAVGLIVDELFPDIDVPQLVVADTALALGEIAAIRRQHFSGKVIGITGSCGKTTVKAMLLAICQGVGKTLATEGNKNNHLGVPLTLLSLEGDERFAIIEAGTSGPKEIAYLGNIICPDIALVNNIAGVHLEGLGSVDNIAEEKADLYRALKTSGIAIINFDDSYQQKFINVNKSHFRVGFGFNIDGRTAQSHLDVVRGEVIEAPQLLETQDTKAQHLKTKYLKISYREQSVDVALSVIGHVNYLNALAAAACALAAGLNLQEVKQGLEAFSGVKGRMQRLPTSVVKLLVDDTYNANPSSAKAAIDYLAAYENSLFILGDMGELGDIAEQAHADIGKHALQKNIGALLAVGRLSKHAVESFGRQGEWYASQQDLIEALQQRDIQHSAVLVKGSRGSKMENIVRAILTFGESQNAGVAG